MFYYFSAFIGATTFFWLSECMFSHKNFKLQNLCIFLAIFVLVLLSGLRDMTVGTDTGAYVYFFDLFKMTKELNLWDYLSEPGYKVVQYLASFFSSSYTSLLIVTAIIPCCLYVLTIKRYAINPIFSFAVFLLLGFYIFHFNGARQGIALSVFFFSIRYIIDREFKRFLYCIIIGFVFHKSILACFPVYFIFNKKFSFKWILFVALSFVVLMFSLGSIVEFLSVNVDSRYSGYAQSGDGGGGVQVLFISFICLWLLFCKRINEINSSFYNGILMMIFIASCIGIMSYILKINPSGILRLTVYFTQFVIFALPVSIASFKDKPLRRLIGLIWLIIMIVYFCSTTMFFSNLYPYRFSGMLFY